MRGNGNSVDGVWEYIRLGLGFWSSCIPNFINISYFRFFNLLFCSKTYDLGALRPKLVKEMTRRSVVIDPEKLQ